MVTNTNTNHIEKHNTFLSNKTLFETTTNVQEMNVSPPWKIFWSFSQLVFCSLERGRGTKKRKKEAHFLSEYDNIIREESPRKRHEPHSRFNQEIIPRTRRQPLERSRSVAVVLRGRESPVRHASHVDNVTEVFPTGKFYSRVASRRISERNSANEDEEDRPRRNPS